MLRETSREVFTEEQVQNVDYSKCTSQERDGGKFYWIGVDKEFKQKEIIIGSGLL